MVSEHAHITLLKKYQELSNRHEIEACVEMFTEDGVIESGNETFSGEDAIRAAHEFDLASRTEVEFRDMQVDDDLVRCTFWNANELSRATGDGGMTSKAEFTIKNKRIYKFNILMPSEDERKRVIEKIGPALKWLRENHLDVVARWKGFDKAAGGAVFELAELWRKHQQEMD